MTDKPEAEEKDQGQPDDESEERPVENLSEVLKAYERARRLKALKAGRPTRTQIQPDGYTREQ